MDTTDATHTDHADINGTTDFTEIAGGLQHGPWSVSWNNDGSWEVSHDGLGRVLASDPENPVRLGLGSPRVQAPAGQLHVDLTGRGMTWLEPSALLFPREPERAGPGWSFDTEDGPRRAYLLFEALPDDRLGIRLDVVDDDLPTAELRFACGEDESFFGLGTQVTGMDLAGRVYPLITQEQGIGKPDRNPILGLQNTLEAAYAPMAVWHSTAGYTAVGAFDTYADLGLCADGEAFLRTHMGAPAIELIPGMSIRERMAGLTAGGPDLQTPARLPAAPPDWVFAPWLSAVGGPDEIELVRTTARERGWPVSAIWSEDWIGGTLRGTGFRLSYRWEWDQETYPDLPGTIALLNDDGFAFLGYFNPFVPTTVPHFEEARDAGYLVAGSDGTLHTDTDPASRTTGLIDLYNPDAVAFVQGYMRTAARDIGLHGWMADFAEWYPHTAQVPDGVSPYARRNAYPVRWQQASREVLDEVHGPGGHAFFARSGWASTGWRTGGVVPALWGGDQNTDWKFDDGYPTVIPIGTHAGLSGVPIFGSDIAGYASFVNAPSDKELWFRWATLGAMSPLMRTHHGSSKCDNWRFDRDEDTLAHFGRWMRIHALLLPTFRLLLDDALAEGLPIMRHPVLVSPDTPAMWTGQDYQYFLGDDLLVSPILEQGEESRAVRLPGPGWWPLFGDEPVSGEVGTDGLVTVQVLAEVTEIPIHVRPGTALPLLGREVDTFFPTDNPDLVTLADAEGTARAVLYPDADGGVAEREWGGVALSATGAPHGGDGRTVADESGALPLCTEADREAPGARCHSPEEGLIRGVWTDETIAIDAGTITLRSLDGQARAWTIGVGGAGWGGLAEPTAVGSLSPDLPPICPDPDPEPLPGEGE